MTTTKTSTTNNGTEAPQEGGQVPPAGRPAGLNTGGSNNQTRERDEAEDRAKDLLMLKVVAANVRVFLYELERQWDHMLAGPLHCGRVMPEIAGADLDDRWRSLLGGISDLTNDLDTIANGGVVVASVARAAEPQAERSAPLPSTHATAQELVRLQRDLDQQANDLHVTSKALERITEAYRRQADELERYRYEENEARADLGAALAEVG